MFSSLSRRVDSVFQRWKRGGPSKSEADSSSPSQSSANASNTSFSANSVSHTTNGYSSSSNGTVVYLPTQQQQQQQQQQSYHGVYAALPPSSSSSSSSSGPPYTKSTIAALPPPTPYTHVPIRGATVISPAGAYEAMPASPSSPISSYESPRFSQYSPSAPASPLSTVSMPIYGTTTPYTGQPVTLNGSAISPFGASAAAYGSAVPPLARSLSGTVFEMDPAEARLLDNLRSTLKQHSLFNLDVGGGGNCFYYSLGDQLDLLEAPHRALATPLYVMPPEPRLLQKWDIWIREVKTRVIQQLKQPKYCEFYAFTEGDGRFMDKSGPNLRQWEAFVNETWSQPGQWATYWCIQAAADAFCCKILLYNPEGAPTPIDPSCSESQQRGTVRLAYVTDHHFQSVRPLSNGASTPSHGSSAPAPAHAPALVSSSSSSSASSSTSSGESSRSESPPMPSLHELAAALPGPPT